MLCAVGISLLSIFASTSSSPVKLAVSGGLPGINLNKYDSKFFTISFMYIIRPSEVCKNDRYLDKNTPKLDFTYLVYPYV